MTEYRDKLLSLSIAPKQSRDQASTVQLPKHYPHAKKHAPDGTVIWTTKQEARDTASRARDAGEHVHFDG